MYSSSPGELAAGVGPLDQTSVRAPSSTPTATAPGARSPMKTTSDLEPEDRRDRTTGGSPSSDDFRASRRSHLGTGTVGGSELKRPDNEGISVRLQVGKMVPGTRYRIVRWLGEGGMGVVYLAEHADIGREVALKILRFDLSQQPRATRVFRDEARTASKIGSRHIVDIFDFGELPDGRLFFCMEVVEGSDLVLGDTQSWMDIERLIPIIRQVCKGLHAAHQANIVHRDIKPENILVTSFEGRPDGVKILDFGISAMLSAGSGQEGSIAGTPLYMAPEQALGAAFDRRLDIYAVGCLMFELLAGRPPFVADELAELLRQQCEDAPPHFADITPDRSIPEELEQVVFRCLAKAPEQRFRDMADLEAALCEAQIAVGVVTAWDDLPIPDGIGDDRRAAILAGMPNPLDIAIPRKRGPLLGAVGAGALALALAGGWVFTRDTNTQASVTIVEEIVVQARNAASRQRYVYPSIREPEAPTALTSVLALESLDGVASEPGQERASTLRGEFADALIEVGDRFWSDDATRSVARDYYLKAVVFDSTRGVAFDRAGVTLGQFAEFKSKAQRANFSEAELLAGQFGSALAIEDTQERDALLMETLEVGEPLSLVGQATRIRAAKNVGVSTTVLKAITEPAPSGDDASSSSTGPEERRGDLGATGGDAPPDESDTTAETGSEAAAADGASTSSAPQKPSPKLRTKRASDPAKSKELAAAGSAALAAGDRKRAAQLFHQALSYNQRNGTALMGLSDVYFDTGRPQQAVTYAERAVRTAPSSSRYRLKLGDALFKVLRYQEALSEYREAKKLGSKRAASRIAKVNAKLGR